MDRTIIAPWKAEEKELSEKLYNKLKGLALLYPVNEELRKLLSWDMFLKPNQQAFFQVMNYLFRLLDPTEFRKRFFWPITDKRDEANFRSSTVEYLKYLKEKHQLQWANIKSYLVVMPGGMKFITFMLDLVSFIVQELIKQREKLLPCEFEPQHLKDMDVKLLTKQNQFIKEFASDYITEIEELCLVFKDSTDKIHDIFNQLSLSAGISIGRLRDDSFLSKFELSNRKLCEEKILNPTDTISLLEQPICQLRETLERYQIKETEDNYNPANVRRAVRNIKEFFQTDNAFNDQDLFAAPSSNEVNIKMNTLLQGYECINETIEKQLAAGDQIKGNNDFVTEELQILKSEIEEIDAQITELQKNLNAKAKQRHMVCNGQQSIPAKEPFTPPLHHVKRRSGTENPLYMKFVSTPTIKLELPSNDCNSNIRLPLQDDFNTKTFNAFNSMLVPAPLRSTRKQKQIDQSADLNTTSNRSKIVDPMQLLRTINKDKSKAKPYSQHNLSSLGAKWKQREELFNMDTSEAIVSPKPAAKLNASSFCATLPSSPFMPMESNEHTRIERVKLVVNECPNESANSLIYSKKSAVMKVLDASLNVQNLSTSPSGRLESLVPLEELKLPKMQINDETFEESLQQAHHPLAKPEQNEKNPNDSITNLDRMKFDFDLCDCDEKDALFNISDSVLQNVSM